MRKETAAFYGALTASMSLLLLALLTFRIMQGVPESDRIILTFFHTLHTASSDTFFKAVTWLGSIKVLLPLYLLLLGWIYRHRFGRKGWWAASPLPLAFATTTLLKSLVGRERPALFSDPVVPLPPDPSFPSGHTTQIFGFVLTLWLLTFILRLPARPLLFVLLGLTALLVAISRLYLQVHFPSDVAAGFLVSTFWASAIFYLLKKKERSHEK